MMFRKTTPSVLTALILSLCATNVLSNPLDFRIGAHLVTSSLSGSNTQNSVTENYKSGSAVLGIDFSLIYNKFFTGVGFSQGSFLFEESKIPRHPKLLNTSIESTVTKAEFDIVLGYQVFSRFSFFFDYKFVNHTWSDSDNKTLGFRGPGFGGIANYPITNKWYAFISLGLGGLEPWYDGKQIGNGTIGMFKLGVLYRWSEKSILTVSYKTQVFDQNYTDDIGDIHQTYKNVGVMFNFNRLI